MIQIKKTILTLVALFAMTAGAWAEGTVTLTEIKASEMPTSWENNNNPAKATDLPGFKAVTRDEAKALGAPAAEGDIYVIYAISYDDFIGLIWNNGVLSDNDGVCSLGAIYALKDVFKFYYVASSASTVEVAWNKASKTGTFTMPGGNVELEPEYYPQAALTAAPTAINDVPATTDGAILKAGTVATIGSTEQAQGTVMYYVSTTALDDAALLALAADAWTADVPTAAHLAQGQAYVYYYVRGNDSDTDDETFSDGDILSANALTVTIAAEPTYAVTFAEGTDPNEWTADPNAGVTKGTPVTVTYTGTRHVKGVKAEKKAAAPATVLSGALVDGAIIKVYFKWEGMNKGDYVQGVYNAASGTFTASKGGTYWATYSSAVYKVEKSGDNIIIGAGYRNYTDEAMVWTFNTTNDTYTTTYAGTANQWPEDFALISVTLNGTDITSQLTAQ